MTEWTELEYFAPRLHLGDTGIYIDSSANWGRWAEDGVKTGTHKGFRTEITHTPIPLWQRANVRFFAGYRKDWYSTDDAQRRDPYSGVIPSANSILILATKTEIRSSAFSLQFSAQMLGSAIGPVTGGMVANAAGNVSAVFITAGLFLLALMIILAFAAPQRVRRISRTNRSGLSDEELRAAAAEDAPKAEQP